MITGKTLIAWGHRPGPWFAAAIAAAEEARCAGADEPAIRAIVERFAPLPAPPSVGLRDHGALPYRLNVRAEDQHEADNIASVERHMRELMRVPTLVAGSVMPDACPAGSAPGTIPVGGVAAAKNAIHPGMHSADICCSMAVTDLRRRRTNGDPRRRHEAQPLRRRWPPPGAAAASAGRGAGGFEANPFLEPVLSVAIEHFATQGDGNHFFYVGRVASTGQIALVTHHGSRKPGAMLYKAGMETAERFRASCRRRPQSTMPGFPPRPMTGEAYWAGAAARSGLDQGQPLRHP